ncbi:MAG TPA: hypothetical protein PKG68_10460, partial [Bacteroidales bacterium]|nr:hypothetical protein [Bacteroidales bacterium]
RTGLEPATLGVTGRYSNQTELPHQKRCKINPIFFSSKYFIKIYYGATMMPDQRLKRLTILVIKALNQPEIHQVYYFCSEALS